MAEKLTFSVNIDSPVAVYVQIENQIQFAIASGRIKPGEMLPSVQKMTALLNINPNTVTKAYRELELLQMVHARRGAGVTISEKGPKISRDNVLGMVKDHLVEAVAECMATGLVTADIKKIVSNSIDAKTPPYVVPERK